MRRSLLGTDTGYTRETVSTSAGDYSFQDLPLGNYDVTITAPVFVEEDRWDCGASGTGLCAGHLRSPLRRATSRLR